MDFFILLGLSGFIFLLILIMASVSSNKHKEQEIIANEKRIKDLVVQLELIQQEKKKNDELLLDEIARKDSEIKKYLDEKSEIIREKETIDILLADRIKSMPWLATMVADYKSEIISPGNYRVSYETKKALEERNRELRIKNRMLTYDLEYLRSKLPKEETLYLDDFDTDQEIPDIRYYLSRDEYYSLPDIEKWKVAFENYKKNRRSRHNVGRDYEMFVGQMYERQNFKVDYHGIKNGIHDLGIDLIAENEKVIYLIQCKNWSNKKTIYEKHMCQLYGTYRVFESKSTIRKEIIPVFITSTVLSETAKEFAKELGILVKENLPLGEYCAIKCNLESHIFHLPFDINYDDIKNYELVSTIEEAVEKGCRHAYKWSGIQE